MQAEASSPRNKATVRYRLASSTLLSDQLHVQVVSPYMEIEGSAFEMLLQLFLFMHQSKSVMLTSNVIE